MSAAAIAQIAVLVALLALLAPPLGAYLARVYAGGGTEPAPGDRVFGPIERLVYRACRVDPSREQGWVAYTLSLLAFSIASVVLLYELDAVNDWAVSVAP